MLKKFYLLLRYISNKRSTITLKHKQETSTVSVIVEFVFHKKIWQLLTTMAMICKRSRFKCLSLWRSISFVFAIPTFFRKNRVYFIRHCSPIPRSCIDHILMANAITPVTGWQSRNGMNVSLFVRKCEYIFVGSRHTKSESPTPPAETLAIRYKYRFCTAKPPLPVSIRRFRRFKTSSSSFLLFLI